LMSLQVKPEAESRHHFKRREPRSERIKRQEARGKSQETRSKSQEMRH